MYRYYGGTRGQSVERDLADLKWAREHGGKDAVQKLGAGFHATAVLIAVICLIAAVGVIALVVWGIQNLVTSGISWQLIVFNPITFIALLVGYGWLKCR